MAVQLYEQRIVQTAQHQDAIDQALREKRVGRDAMVAKIDSLTATANTRTGAVEDTSSRVRRASFAIRQAPYTLTASVELPPPPDTRRLAARISLDQIPLVARLSCGAPNHDGIRPASIETSAPPWASVTFTDVQQSADLCRSPALKPRRSWLAFKLLVIGGGRVTTPDGHTAWGAFIGSGFAFGGEDRPRHPHGARASESTKPSRRVVRMALRPGRRAGQSRPVARRGDPPRSSELSAAE